jgi:hypothetical protein
MLSFFFDFVLEFFLAHTDSIDLHGDVSIQHENHFSDSSRLALAGSRG